MKHWILVVLFLWIAHAAALRAEPFEKAEVTKTINIVSLLPEDKPPEPAQTGDVVTGKTALKNRGPFSGGIAVPGPDHHPRGLQFALPVYCRRMRDGFEWRHHVVFLAERRRRRQGTGWVRWRGGIRISNFQYRRKGQGDLPESQGPGLFYGESQDSRCVTARTDGRYRGRGYENAARHEHRSRSATAVVSAVVKRGLIVCRTI
jgi:hypothetical protein